MQKKEARTLFLEKRLALTPDVVHQESKKIKDWIFQSLPIHAYSTIHLFLPILKQNEVNTKLIIETLQKDFKATRIVLPRMEANASLSHHLFLPSHVLTENKWGVLEPSAEAPSIKEIEIDLVFVPLLAFDKKGNRVGYGKGFYDIFLAKCQKNTIKVGLSIFDPVDVLDDVGNHDIGLDMCITPRKVWVF